MIYFMLDKNGKQGHPTTKFKFVSKQLRDGTAKIVSRTKDTITIQLLNKEFHDEDTVDSEFRLGLDPGYKHIGFSVFKIFKDNIIKLFCGEVETRTPDITKNLTERKMYRRKRRYNRRKNVLRKYSKVKFRHPIWKNRAKHKFQPTHTHLINTHLNLINWLKKHIPINKIHIEYSKFDIHKIINPSVYSFWYQRGPQFAFENVKSYIRSRDNYTCQICKKNCLSDNHVHHIKYRRNGGSDKPDNLILLCPICHDKVHAGLVRCPSIKNRNLKESGVLNSCMKKIFSIFESQVPTQDTLGSITKTVRLNSGLDKTHSNDAKIIAFCDSLTLQDIEDYNYVDLNNHVSIKQYRRHDRAWVKRLEDRKYYITDTGKPKTVAWNRSKSSTQKKDSLTDFRKNNYSEKVYAKLGGPVYRRSNTQRKFKPGDLIKYLGNIDICKGWASTQSKVILENHGYVKQKDCTVIRNNSGLVFV